MEAVTSFISSFLDIIAWVIGTMLCIGTMFLLVLIVAGIVYFKKEIGKFFKDLPDFCVYLFGCILWHLYWKYRFGW
jgi:hypothetical protein